MHFLSGYWLYFLMLNPKKEDTFQRKNFMRSSKITFNAQSIAWSYRKYVLRPIKSHRLIQKKGEKAIACMTLCNTH